jgi:hypothetical protein
MAASAATDMCRQQEEGAESVTQADFEGRRNTVLQTERTERHPLRDRDPRGFVDLVQEAIRAALRFSPVQRQQSVAKTDLQGGKFR